jgi:capsular exopolysaccharide synthesis family protein
MEEAFDFLRVNLRLQAAGGSARVIGVTSTIPGEGKTTVTSRLARAFARLGADVIAVDCDLRKPMLAVYMGVDGSRGLTNLLVEDVPPGDLVAGSAFGGVRVLPSGPTPPNPSVLLGLPRFARVLAELRDQTDYVVADTPPVLAGVDTSAIAQAVDAMVLVVDLDRSNREALKLARDQLAQANTRLIGIVLNRVPDRMMQYGYDADYYTGPDLEPASESRRSAAKTS